MRTQRALERGSPVPHWIRVKHNDWPLRNGRKLPASSVKGAGGLAQSKTWRSLIAASCFVAAALSSQAQSLSIDWFTIDGGGGTSSGGAFAVSGTVGQADANTQTLTGGNFSLAGGFWSLFAVQTPGAPLLSIRLTAAHTLAVSWPSPSTGFLLQQTDDLNTPNWVTAPQSVSDNGTSKFILVNPSAGNRFYRLFKP